MILIEQTKNVRMFLLGEWMGSGVPYGLQNQYEELRASWVGSIPTHSRQLNTYKAKNIDTQPFC